MSKTWCKVQQVQAGGVVGARGVQVVGDFFPRRLHDAIVSLDEPVIARGAARRFLGLTHMPNVVVLDAACCVCH